MLKKHILYINESCNYDMLTYNIVPMTISILFFIISDIEQ